MAAAASTREGKNTLIGEVKGKFDKATSAVLLDYKGMNVENLTKLRADFRKAGKSGGNSGAAEAIGKLLAARAKEKGINQVAFDRGSYRYHGRIQALADAARAGGLDF